jgi:hypothetical protein
MLTPETLLLQDRQEHSKMPEIHVAALHVMRLLDVLQHPRIAASEPVQEAGVLLLRLMTVANVDGSGQAHVSHKTVTVILAAMSRPSSSSSTSSTNQNVRMATHGCGPLRELSSGHYTSNQNAKQCMGAGGGLELLTGALKLAPKDAVLQEQACGAIRNAIGNNTDNKLRLGASEASEPPGQQGSGRDRTRCAPKPAHRQTEPTQLQLVEILGHGRCARGYWRRCHHARGYS